MSPKRKTFDLSKCPTPLEPEFVTMDDKLYSDCDLYSEYVERATLVEPGQSINSNYLCECIVNGELCRGEVEVKRLDIPKEVRWKCNRCGDEGAVINFEGSYWDLSDIPEDEKQEYLNPDATNFPQFDEEAPDEWMQSMENQFGAMLDDLSDEDYEDLQNFVGHMMAQRPDDPSPENAQVPLPLLNKLVESDWLQNGAPIYLRDDLSYDEVKKSLFLHNARVFLEQLKEDGKFKLTSSENLKRETVKKLFETCTWPDNYAEEVKTVNKTLNEQDVWLLHFIRVLLDLAGMIKKRKGSFYLVKKRAHFLKKENAGKLYRHLFSTLFKKMNIGYISNRDEVPLTQSLVPYMLFRLSELPKKWHSLEKLFIELVLPGMEQELWTQNYDGSFRPDDIYYLILSPLRYFGLIEVKKVDDDSDKDLFAQRFGPPDLYRKTELFEKFIEFNLE